SSPTSTSASSSASTGRGRCGSSRSAAPASASRWSSASPTRITAASRSPARRGRAPRSRCGCRCCATRRPAPPGRDIERTSGTESAKKILVIEDEPDIVRGLADALRFEGFEVEARGTGSDGLDAAGEWGPDLVLLDLMLPDDNGYRVCEALRQRDP